MAKKRKATKRRTARPKLHPAKIAINPRTGKVRIFVSKKVASVAKNPKKGFWKRLLLGGEEKPKYQGNEDYQVWTDDEVGINIHSGTATLGEARDMAKEARAEGESVVIMRLKKDGRWFKTARKVRKGDR